MSFKYCKCCKNTRPYLPSKNFVHIFKVKFRTVTSKCFWPISQLSSSHFRRIPFHWTMKSNKHWATTTAWHLPCCTNNNHGKQQLQLPLKRFIKAALPVPHQKAVRTHFNPNPLDHRPRLAIIISGRQALSWNCLHNLNSSQNIKSLKIISEERARETRCRGKIGFVDRNLKYP